MLFSVAQCFSIQYMTARTGSDEFAIVCLEESRVSMVNLGKSAEMFVHYNGTCARIVHAEVHYYYCNYLTLPDSGDGVVTQRLKSHHAMTACT